MADLITFTPNPTIDVSTTVETVAPFHKMRCSAQNREPGGGGVNVARVVRRLGADAVAVYPSGGSTGELLRRLLEMEGVSGPLISFAQETRENFTVLERSTGKQYRFVLPGPRVDAHECQRWLDTLVQTDAPPCFVVASGSLPPGAPDDLFAQAAKIAAHWHARFIVDTSGPPLAAAIAQGAYLIKPNLREFSELTGMQSNDEVGCIAAARHLVDVGRVEIVALTLGHRGAYLIARGQVLRAPALDITPVSVVGAGDSFLGGMVYGLLAGEDLAAAFRRGIAAGSAALLAEGTGLCSREDVERLLPLVKVEKA